MADVSKMSDEELLRVFKQQKAKPAKVDVTTLSDEDLVNLHQGGTLTRQPESDPLKPAAEFATGLAKKGLEGVQAAGQFVDKFTGAPTRAGISALQQGKGILGAGAAFGKQFGEDPTRAPTGKDIAREFGVPATEFETPFRSFDLPGERVKTTAQDVAGLGIDVLADPTLVVPVGTVAKGAAAVGKAVGKVATKAAVKGAKAAMGAERFAAASKRLARTFTGVNEAAVTEYLSRPFARVNAARPINEIAEDAFDSISKLKDEVVDLSARSYDVLEKSDAVLTGKDIKKIIDAAEARIDKITVGKAQGIGGVSKSTVSQLRGMIDDLKKASGAEAAQEIGTGVLDASGKEITRTIPAKGGQISAADAKNILQQIDNMTDYGTGVGGFDNQTNAAFKSIRKSIDKILKPKVPEYKAIMEGTDDVMGLSEKTTRLGDASKVFGNRDTMINRIKGVSKLNRTRLGDEDVLKKFGEAVGKDFITEAEDRLILEAFGKATTQGSRKVQLGKGIGAALGSLTGTEAGAVAGFGAGGAVGSMLDISGTQFVKKAIDFGRSPVTFDLPARGAKLIPDRSIFETAAKGAQVLSTQKTEREREEIRKALRGVQRRSRARN
jgi:hypothetical protein